MLYTLFVPLTALATEVDFEGNYYFEFEDVYDLEESHIF
jgi:hypothetical protein